MLSSYFDNMAKGGGQEGNEVQGQKRTITHPQVQFYTKIHKIICIVTKI